MKASAIKNQILLNQFQKKQFLVLFLINCLALSCFYVPILAEKNVALSFFQTQAKQHLIRVDATRVKDAQIKKIIGEAVKESPFVVKENDNSESWDVRFRSDEKDSNKIIVEREGETQIKEISLKENSLAVQITKRLPTIFAFDNFGYLNSK